jgi:hypothetical protein
LVISDGQKRVIDTLLYKTNKATEFKKLIYDNATGHVSFERKKQIQYSINLILLKMETRKKNN